ncbi:hypothetical protein [Bacillus sp. JCM 19034]|uniref:hypothetical protein n=1 Tax=Bacillus sp. JCM 19034 TaxID=1481928 RepID=UPI0007859EF4|nr:hypothetical protein [Bacillus sp. JCM 19034]
MSRLMKSMLLWMTVFPLTVISLLLLIDNISGEPIKPVSYLPNFLGFALGGLFIGFILYHVKKFKQ